MTDPIQALRTIRELAASGYEATAGPTYKHIVRVAAAAIAHEETK